MGFYFSIPLPGPFRYSKRIGGRRRTTHKTVTRKPHISKAEQARRDAYRAERIAHYRAERLDRESRTFTAVAKDVTHDQQGNLVFTLQPWDETRPTIKTTIEAARARQMSLVSLRSNTTMTVILGKDGASFEYLSRA